MDKVYCKDCKWIVDNQKLEHECNHPTNERKVSTYYMVTTHRKWTPEYQNRNNVCQHYKKQESDRKIPPGRNFSHKTGKITP